MANRIKTRVKTAFASTRHADRGKPRGGQDKPRHPGYDKRNVRKSVGTRQVKEAYAKRKARS